jgi:hypothetical protein
MKKITPGRRWNRRVVGVVGVVAFVVISGLLAFSRISDTKLPRLLAKAGTYSRRGGLGHFFQSTQVRNL